MKLVHGLPSLVAEKSCSTDTAAPGQLAYMWESTAGSV